MKVSALVLLLACACSATLYYQDPEVYYYTTNWYRFSRNHATQPQAEAYCLAHGGHLAIVDDKNENNWIYNTFSAEANNVHNSLWIGTVRNLAGDLNKPFNWSYVDGSDATSFIAQYEGCTRGVNCLWDSHKLEKRDEPNNLKGDEYCVAYTAPYISSNAGAWKDEECRMAYRFVCKFDFGTTYQDDWVGVGMSGNGKYQSAASSNLGTSTPGFIYTSNDYGVSWHRGPYNLFWTSVALSLSGKFQSATDGGPGHIWTSSDFGNSWTRSDSISTSWADVVLSSTGEYQTAVDSTPGYIYTSLDYGKYWTVAYDVPQTWSAVVMSYDGRYQTAVSIGVNSTYAGQIVRSYDWGNTFHVALSIDTAAFYTVATSADGHHQLTADGNNGNVYTSSDFGATWQTPGTGPAHFTADWSGVAVSSNGHHQYIAKHGGGIYASQDYGQHFIPTSAPTGNWYWLETSASGQYISAADNGGYIWLSSDYGVHWTHG